MEPYKEIEISEVFEQNDDGKLERTKVMVAINKDGKICNHKDRVDFVPIEDVL